MNNTVTDFSEREYSDVQREVGSQCEYQEDSVCTFLKKKFNIDTDPMECKELICEKCPFNVEEQYLVEKMQLIGQCKRCKRIIIKESIKRNYCPECAKFVSNIIKKKTIIKKEKGETK